MKFRTGRHNNRTVYFQGGSEPDSKDRFVCVAMTKAGAVVIATALNRYFRQDTDRDPTGGIGRYELGTQMSVDASE